MSDPPVLIVGAGISGLVLAQSLRRLGVRFEIFDRDSALDARSGGWGLTLHWALPVLRDLLPEHLVKRFPETFVNKDASSRGDVGSFQFFNLKSGEALYSVPAEERIRVNRGRLRELLTSGIDVHVSDLCFCSNPFIGYHNAHIFSGTKPSPTSNPPPRPSTHSSMMTLHTLANSWSHAMEPGRVPARSCTQMAAR